MGSKHDFAVLPMTMSQSLAAWATRSAETGPYLKLRQLLADRTGTIGICGLGYVGLPLAVAAAEAGMRVIGFDIDATKIQHINAGHSYLGTVPSEAIFRFTQNKRLQATSEFDRLSECDVIVICVPTPLTRQREPDLSFVEGTARTIAARLRRAQLVVLESTTFPGTTDERVKPILEATGLASGRDFFLGFSPEREDPGNRDFATTDVPKVLSGDGPEALDLVNLFYGAFFQQTVPVTTNATAEAVKITENVFRAVNIALVNELKVIYEAMGIDIWEVIDAAKTKPFGFMAFYPGPGLGGHCIPIDPFYLTWKSREFDLPTRFVELAGEINVGMPRYVVGRLEEALGKRLAVPLNGAHVLIVGVAYKRNVDDIRESPSLKLIELLEARGAIVHFHDPHVPVIPPTREHALLAGRHSVALTADSLTAFQAVLIATDHDAIDYRLIVGTVPLVVDTRNAIARRGLAARNVVKA